MRHRKAIFNGCRIKWVKKRASESQEKSRDDIMVYNMVAVEPLKMYIQGSTFSLVTKLNQFNHPKTLLCTLLSGKEKYIVNELCSALC